MKVILRKRKGKKGITSLYLAIWDPNIEYSIKSGKNEGTLKKGKWKYEYLKLYLAKDKAQNKETLKLAEQIKIKRQFELQNEMHGFISPFKKKVNFLQFFVDYGRDDKNWSATLKHLKEFAGEYVDFELIDEIWIESFKDYLIKKLSRNSAFLYFTIFKASMNIAIKKKFIQINPARYIDNIKKIETEKVYLTFEEIQNLIKVPIPQSEVKRAFLFACYTGLRVSDIENLSWENIEDGKLKFRQKKTKGFEYFPLSETAKALMNYKNKNKLMGKVFNLPCQRWMNDVLKKWAKLAGINKHMSFHVSRHTFATLALTSGADLYVVSKLLGHSNIETTQVYAQIIDERKEEAVNLLPKLDIGD